MPYMPCETKGCRNYRKVPQAFCPKCQAKADTTKRKATKKDTFKAELGVTYNQDNEPVDK